MYTDVKRCQRDNVEGTEVPGTRIEKRWPERVDMSLMATRYTATVLLVVL